MLDLLRKLPEGEAQHVLKRLRSGTDVGALVSHIRDGDLLVQMALEPESRFRYDFPCRPEMPEELLIDNMCLSS